MNKKCLPYGDPAKIICCLEDGKSLCCLKASLLGVLHLVLTPASEVANLTERKNPHTRTWCERICLSVCYKL